MLHLYRVRDAVDDDLHLVIDAEHEGAGVLHAPFHVGHLEDADHDVLAPTGIYREGEQDFVFHAVNGEHAVQLHLRLAFGGDLAIHAVGTKGDFGIFGDLQNGGVHSLVAGRAAALAAGGVHHDLARRLAGLRVEGQRTALEMEVPVYRVQQAAESELHLGLRGVDGERARQRGDGFTGQQDGGHAERYEQTHQFHHKVSID